MTTPTKPNAGALRAARVLEGMSDAAHKGQRPQLIADEIAEVIDQESGLAELLEAAKGVIDPIPQDEIDECEQYKRLQLAIRSAGNPANPNAETVQSYPSGRWTEKGTV